MNDSPEAKSLNLTRQEVLSAIDYEIAHRESVLTRHGISTWGIVIAVIALLWTSTVEILSTSHDWTNALLVFLTGHWILGLIATPWVRSMGWGIPLPPTNRRCTFKEVMVQHGFDMDALPYHIIHIGILMVISIYLGFKGFLVLGITLSIFYGLVVALFCFFWLLCRIRLPLKFQLQNQKSARQSRSMVLFRLLAAVGAIIPLNALMTVWPVQISDAKLGLILAALYTLFSYSILLIRPPTTTNRLRSLRSRLAFGDVEVDTAKREADCILHGTPEEQYLTDKADEAIADLEEYERLCNSIVERIERVTALSEKLRASASDQVLVHETASEFRLLYDKMRSGMRSMEKHNESANKLLAELRLRIETSKILLNIKPEIIASIQGRVDTYVKAAAAARKHFAEKTEQFGPALNFLCESLKGLKSPRKLTISDAYSAFFRD